MKKLNSKYFPVIILFLFHLSIFLPYLLSNGFIVDDWGIINTGEINSTFGTRIVTYFPYLTFRPLSAVLYGLTVFLKFNPVFYNLLNFIFFMTGLFMVSLTLKKIFGCFSSYIFLLIAPLSVISNTWIFSAATYYPCNFSIILWGLSLYLLYLHSGRNSTLFYYLSHLMVLLGCLIYDTIIFLTICNIFLPVYLFFRDHTFSTKTFLFKLLRNAIPIFIIVLLIFFYQNIIVQRIGGENLSRLNFHMHVVYQLPGYLFSYFKVLLIQFPLLLMTSVTFISSENILQYLLPVSLLLLILYKVNFGEFRKIESPPIHYVVLVFLVFFVLFQFFLFLLSGYPFQIGGYENRTMHGLWIMLTLFIAITAARLNSTKFNTLLFLFAGFLSIALITQREFYSQSYKLQVKILNDCISKVKKANEFKKDDKILGNVPLHFAVNFNNEIIFSQPYDWGNALNIFSGRSIVGGLPLNYNSLKDGVITVNDDYLVFAGWYKMDVTRIWYYEYDIVNGNSRLFKISDRDHLNEVLFHDMVTTKLNSYDKPFYQRY